VLTDPTIGDVGAGDSRRLGVGHAAGLDGRRPNARL
jgi:hypothetical protein